MLLQVGNKIFNTDRIIVAELDEKSERPNLYLRLAGGGHKDLTFTHETFYGETARQVWLVLQSEATLVTAEVEEEGVAAGGKGVEDVYGFD